MAIFEYVRDGRIVETVMRPPGHRDYERVRTAAESYRDGEDGWRLQPGQTPPAAEPPAAEPEASETPPATEPATKAPAKPAKTSGSSASNERRTD